MGSMNLNKTFNTDTIALNSILTGASLNKRYSCVFNFGIDSSLLLFFWDFHLAAKAHCPLQFNDGLFLLMHFF